VSINAQDVKVLREKTGAGIMDCKQALSECGGDFDKAVKYLREKGLAEAKKRSGREAKEGIITIVFSNDKKQALMVEINCETDFVSRTDQYRLFVHDIANCLLEKDVDDVSQLPEEVKVKVKEASAAFGENIILRKVVRFKKLDPVKSVFDSYIHLDGKVGVIVEFFVEDPKTYSDPVFKEFSRNICMQIASMGPISISRDDVPEEILEEQREIFTKQTKESGKPEKIIDKIVSGKMEKYFSEFCLLNQKYVRDSNISVGEYLKQTEQKVSSKIQIKRFARFKLGEE